LGARLVVRLFSCCGRPACSRTLACCQLQKIMSKVVGSMSCSGALLLLWGGPLVVGPSSVINLKKQRARSLGACLVVGLFSCCGRPNCSRTPVWYQLRNYRTCSQRPCSLFFEVDHKRESYYKRGARNKRRAQLQDMLPTTLLIIF
jgi:hypothetical protein